MCGWKVHYCSGTGAELEEKLQFVPRQSCGTICISLRKRKHADDDAYFNALKEDLQQQFCEHFVDQDEERMALLIFESPAPTLPQTTVLG